MVKKSKSFLIVMALMLLGGAGTAHADTWSSYCILTLNSNGTINTGDSTSGVVINKYDSSTGQVEFTCPNQLNPSGSWRLLGPAHDQYVTVACKLNGTLFQPQSFTAACSPSGNELDIQPLVQGKTYVGFNIYNPLGATVDFSVSNAFCNTKTTGFASLNTSSCVDYSGY